MIVIKLYELMWKNKIKGFELAKLTQLTPATISKLLKGEDIDIKISTLNKICNYFDCKIEDLLEFKKD